MGFIFAAIPMAIALIYLIQFILEAPAFGLLATAVCVVVVFVMLTKIDNGRILDSFLDTNLSTGKSPHSKTFNRYSEERANELRRMATGTPEEREEFKKLLGRQYSMGYIEHAIAYIAHQEGWTYYPPGSQNIPK